MTHEQSKFIDDKGGLYQAHIPFEEWMLYSLKIGEILGESIVNIDMWYLKECYICNVTCLSLWDKEEDF